MQVLCCLAKYKSCILRLQEDKHQRCCSGCWARCDCGQCFVPLIFANHYLRKLLFCSHSSHLEADAHLYSIFILVAIGLCVEQVFSAKTHTALKSAVEGQSVSSIWSMCLTAFITTLLQPCLAHVLYSCIYCSLLFPVKDWALSECCTSCSDVYLKGGHSLGLN